MFSQTKTISIQSYFKHRLAREINLTDEYLLSSSTNRIHTFELSSRFSFHRELTTLTKTQIKVIITVVFIISFIMLIIAFFRFKNACRTEEADNLQTDIIRNRASQYSEPSSRRGSVGYYTQRYNRPTNLRLDDQLNLSLPNKRLSIPACDPLSKVTAVSVFSSSPGDLTDVKHQHHHVTTSCDTSKISDLKPVTYTSILYQSDDQIPLLTTELTSIPKDSLNYNTRKYSLNALLPLVRPSNSHPFCSALTSTIAEGNNTGNNHNVDLKTRRRASLSSSLRRSIFSKQPQVFCSAIDTSTTTKTISSAAVIPIQTTDIDNRVKLTGAYSKDFMQKIERFRFIDDSASSTTTVTSPVESVERETNHHVIHNAIERFDDDMNCLIDCLDTDLLIDSSYSDFKILQRPKTFKPVNEKFLQTTGRNLSQYPTNPINIPHSITSLPLSKQRYQGDLNGHSRSMDFHSIVANRREHFDNNSSSSTLTLTSQRSLTSLEFDDNSKPSGVLVDDDFLPMSSPIDEHFWTMSKTNSFQLNHHECFPNVGSSPDVEIKHFDVQQMNNLSETSADEDEDSTSSLMTQSEIFTVQEYKIKELDKPLVILKENSPSDPSINSTDQFIVHNNNNHSTTLSPDQSLIENLPNFPEQEILSEDDTQDSSANDASEGDESADNGEIDLEQEFHLSQNKNHSWTINNQDIYLIEKNDLSIPMSNNRPTSIMKLSNSKSNETPPDESQEQQQQQTFKPKVRFNLDPQYEREREWNKVNKLLGNSVEWTDEFEV